jgi:DNA-binding MarR family transcriptional regulator
MEQEGPVLFSTSGDAGQAKLATTAKVKQTSTFRMERRLSEADYIETRKRI